MLCGAGVVLSQKEREAREQTAPCALHMPCTASYMCSDGEGETLRVCFILLPTKLKTIHRWIAKGIILCFFSRWSLYSEGQRLARKSALILL